MVKSASVISWSSCPLYISLATILCAKVDMKRLAVLNLIQLVTTRKRPKGTTYIHVNLINHYCVEKCVLCGSILRKKNNNNNKKKNLFHRRNRWNILWLYQIPGSSLIFDSNLMICKLDDREAKFRHPDQGSHGCPRFFLCSLFSRTCFKRFCLCFFSIFLHTWLIER